MGFDAFLKQLDFRLHSDYVMELMNLRVGPTVANTEWQTPKPVFNISEVKSEYLKLKKISQLPNHHPAKKYIEDRKIPLSYHGLFRWCPTFKAFTNKLKPGKFDEPLEYEEGRIIIPYFTMDNKLFAYNGRAVYETKNGLRYIIIILDHDVPRVFGLNTVDVRKNIFVFEGEMDSTFIENSLAVGGQHISELTSLGTVDKFVIVFDNEPRSIQTKKKLILAIKQGFRVAIWPDSVIEKDINAMIQSGYTADHVRAILEKNTFSDLAAQARLAAWSKT